MARPSVALERREQIIEATMTTIAEHGISGTTLDRIADAVGMSRGHVRHFVGNRDRLLLDTAVSCLRGRERRGRVDHPGRSQRSRGGAGLPLRARVQLARPRERRGSGARRALAHAAPRSPRSSPRPTPRRACSWQNWWPTKYPDASTDACVTVAYGILTSALGSVFLGDFDADPSRMARSRAAVEALLTAL